MGYPMVSSGTFRTASIDGAEVSLRSTSVALSDAMGHLGYWPVSILPVLENERRVLHPLGPDIQWVESYVADDKTFCVSSISQRMRLLSGSTLRSAAFRRRHYGLLDSSEFLKPMCVRRWPWTNQGGEVAAGTMKSPVRCCGGGGRTRPNFQMENRPARDGSQATATEIGLTSKNCRIDHSPWRQLRAKSDGIAALRYSLRRSHDNYDTEPEASLKNRRGE